MIEVNLKYQKVVEQYILFWEGLNVRSIALLNTLVQSGYVFEDPYQHALGIQAAEQVLAHRLSCCPRMVIKVNDFAWGRLAGRGFMFWEMRYDHNLREGFKMRNMQVRVQGVSEVLFGPDGLVASHQDFWGAHSHFNVSRYRVLPSNF